VKAPRIAPPRGLPLSTLVAGILITVVVLAAVFAPVVTPYDPDAQELSASLAKPSAAHVLGADKLGRDLASRLAYGGRTTLFSALLVVAISTSIGTALGLVAGYYGGWIDSLLSRVFDVLLAFPALLLALVVAAAFGRGLGNAVASLSVVYVPMITRLVRSACLVERGLPYVEAGVALGYSGPRIMFRHILPNVLPLLLVQIAIDFGYSILDLAAMSFLGLGVQPPVSDWGAMLADARDSLLLAPRLALLPGLAIMIVVVSFNILGDGLREAFERRQLS
jgi:peptide/nickel transport system permease protein